MTTPKYPSHEAARKAGYHSRRNETAQPQQDARRAYETKSSRNRARAARRTAQP